MLSNLWQAVGHG